MGIGERQFVGSISFFYRYSCNFLSQVCYLPWFPFFLLNINNHEVT